MHVLSCVLLLCFCCVFYVFVVCEWVSPSILVDVHRECDDVSPNDTAYTRWSCHSGLANSVQIVSTPPAPSNGCPITVF